MKIANAIRCRILTGLKLARNLRQQAPDRDNRYAKNAAVEAKQSSASDRFSDTAKKARATQETADGYRRVIARLCDGWRVIVCKDDLLWILQRRKNGGAEHPWRGVGYFRTCEALMRLCAASCLRIDPAALAALAALPERIGGSA